MKKKIFVGLSFVFVLVITNFAAGFKLVLKEDTKYCGSTSFTKESETIYYATKDTASYSIKGDIPVYYKQTEDSGCANIAGTVVIGYYDKFCEELIPNYKSYIQIGTIFKYKTVGIETLAVMDELYSLMDTDVGSSGTSYRGFHRGMNQYANNRGYSYLTEELGSLNFNKYKSAVESGKPIVLFLDNYSYAEDCLTNDTSEVINSLHCTAPHVVVGCGYKIDTYYGADGQVTAVRNYLKVASGDVEYKLTYLCLDGKSKIDKADSIIIR